LIKNIYFFGTSHTAGGGFEFESKLKFNIGEETSGNLKLPRGEFVKSIYKDLFPEEELTQENFSFPGQFRKLCNDRNLNINVINISKQGYGNERIYRKFYEILKDKNFNKEKSLFIFELSDIERKELFYRPLNSHITLNYNAVDRNFYTNDISLKEPKKNNYVELGGYAKSYWYETDNDLEILKNDKDFFKKYIEKTISAEMQIQQLNINNINFLSFLKLNNINFLISEMHSCLDPHLRTYYDFIDNHIISYYDTEKKYKRGFIDFTHRNQLLIADETKYKYTDLHPGFTAIKLIAKNIFNDCVRKKYINSDIIEINKKDFIYPTIQNTVI
jgi:hypothetical protein